MVGFRLRQIGWVVALFAGSSAAAWGQATPAAVGGSILQQRYDKAQRLQAAGDVVGAAGQYRIFLADALGEIAVGLAGARAFDEAANDFDEALRLVPEFPLLRLQYARAALEAGKVDRAKLQALQVLGSKAVTKPAAAGAHEVLGRLLLRADDDAGAKREFEQAVALDPTFANGYELAVAELDLGDAKGAAAIFAEMVKAYGDGAQLHLYFGQAYAGSDFQAEAMAEFKAAQARDPRLPGLHYCLAVAYLADGEAHVKEAEAELRQEIAEAPNDAPALAALGHLLAGTPDDPARRAEAERDLERATELDPASPDGFLFLGQLEAATDRPREAMEALRRSIALTTDPSRNAYQVQKAHYLLGRLLLKAGQEAEGKAELAQSEELMHRNLHRDQRRMSEYLGGDKAEGGLPAMPDAVNHPAASAGDAGRVKALEGQLGPAMADAYNNLGAIAAGAGEFRFAVTAFEHAAVWNPRLAGLDFNWGRAAFAAGQAGEAIGPLGRYLRAHPEDDGARAVLGLCLFREKQFQATRATLAPLQAKADTALQVRFAYADSLVETGDVAEGIAQMEALAKANPGVAEIQNALKAAHARRGAAHN